MATSDSTLDALLSLLDDQDELVYSSVRVKLLSMGTAILVKLEEAIFSAGSAEHARKIEEIIFQIKREILVEKMRHWINSGDKSMLEGWLLISSIHHPNISKEKIEQGIHNIYQDAWLEIAESMTSLEKVAIINHILFRINGFEISGQNVPRVENIVIDNLLFSRKGDVFSLTMLYLILARSLHLDLLPIMLANKLLLVYEDNLASSLAYGSASDKYLFYINVAHRGSVISPKEVQFLCDKSQKYGKGVTGVESDISLISKLLKFMNRIYTDEGDPQKIQLTNDFLELIARMEK
ncbi:MAG TPA: transglutaminase family protein [Prolixibacteraceae bacterium]